MNFSHALSATDDAERDRRIAEIVAQHDWLDVAARHMTHGGWPEAAQAKLLHFSASDEGFVVRLAIDLVELCPQGCNAYPRRFDETLVLQLVIDRRTGDARLTPVP